MKYSINRYKVYHTQASVARGMGSQPFLYFIFSVLLFFVLLVVNAVDDVVHMLSCTGLRYPLHNVMRKHKSAAPGKGS